MGSVKVETQHFKVLSILLSAQLGIGHLYQPPPIKARELQGRWNGKNIRTGG